MQRVRTRTRLGERFVLGQKPVAWMCSVWICRWLRASPYLNPHGEVDDTTQ